jgi:hypothetical protein
MSLDAKTLAQLSAYLDDALSLREKSDVDVLLFRNPEAKRALEALRQLRAQVGKLPQEAPPDSFYKTVWRRIDAEPARRSWLAFAPLKTAGALAAVALVAVATHDMWRGARHKSLADMAEEAPSPLQMLQTPAGAQQAVPTAPGALGVDLVSSDEGPLGESKKEVRAQSFTAPPLPAARQEPAPSPAPLLKRSEPAAVGGGADFLRTDAPPSLLNELDAAGERSSLEMGMKKAKAAGSVASERDRAVFLREWKGTNSGIRAFQTAAVKSQAEWTALWALHVPGAVPPPVDFAQDMVLAVFAGEKPTGGHVAEIVRFTLETAQGRAVYRLTAPPADALSTQALITPFHIVLVKRTDLPIRFDPQ